MTFRLTDSQVLRDYRGRVKWTPKKNERVRWLSVHGEYVGRIARVLHDGATLVVTVIENPVKFKIRPVGSKLTMDAGAVRPFNYEGALADLEIVR